MEELLKQLLDGQNQLFEGQKQITDRLVHLEQGQKQIEAKIDAGFKNTKEANDAILDLIEKTYRETEKVAAQLDNIADENTFLLKKSAQHDADIRSLRKAL